MSDEDRMDALLRQMAAEEYNRPPEIVPREQMWEAILQGSGKREAGTAGGNREPGTVLPFRSPGSAMGVLRGCGGAAARAGNSARAAHGTVAGAAARAADHRAGLVRSHARLAGLGVHRYAAQD